jgi:hypothetical protein
MDLTQGIVAVGELDAAIVFDEEGLEGILGLFAERTLIVRKLE